MKVSKTVALVDPLSTGVHLAPEFASRGWTAIAVLSSSKIPAAFAKGFRPADFPEIITHAGDLDATAAELAAFEPDAYMREPAGDGYVHRGTDDLRGLYELFFSDDGGISLEHCAVADVGRACALEYNVVAWGGMELPPQAGLAVYVRGDSGRLAAARVYDDSDPPQNARA